MNVNHDMNMNHGLLCLLICNSMLEETEVTHGGVRNAVDDRGVPFIQTTVVRIASDIREDILANLDISTMQI